MGVFPGMLVRMGAGVGIFLYGMHLISGYLEELAGTAMERGLRRLTGNPWTGTLTGMVITTLVQSSTAVTVMTVNFVDRGMMTLYQAVGVILGANVGTASTGVLAALPIRSMAPLFLAGGAVLVLAADILGKVQNHVPQEWMSVRVLPARVKLAGALCMGLGMLLLGMELMQEAMAPCRSLRGLTRLLADLDHPVGGVLGGAVFTALIQSSSASVAILQSMAAEGMVGLQQSAYIVYGQNIGTCLTALWASIHLSPAARSCARLHLLINLLGTGFFMAADKVIPLTGWVGSWTPGNPALQIANLHLFFNLASTLLLLPFSRGLVKVVERKPVR